MAQRILVACQHGFAPFSQAFPSANLVVATNLWSVFVVLAQSRLKIEPETRLLRFLATQKSRKMEVDFGDQFFGKVLRAKRMRCRVVRSRRI